MSSYNARTSRRARLLERMRQTAARTLRRRAVPPPLILACQGYDAGCSCLGCHAREEQDAAWMREVLQVAKEGE